MAGGVAAVQEIGGRGDDQRSALGRGEGEGGISGESFEVTSVRRSLMYAATSGTAIAFTIGPLLRRGYVRVP